jgi:SAM-dependent methyltransferase
VVAAIYREWMTVVRAVSAPTVATIAGATSAALLASALFIRTTRIGKFEEWAEILDGLRLRGDETLLDLGCAIAVDIWRADQTDNSRQNTLRNAELEGVADRVDVRTADITNLPFDIDSVDVIVSSLVVHNIPGAANRAKAISEAARVLRPGGRLVLADIWATRRHVRQLRELGWTDARRHGLG